MRTSPTGTETLKVSPGIAPRGTVVVTLNNAAHL
jgi:hypothetical protein